LNIGETEAGPFSPASSFSSRGKYGRCNRGSPEFFQLFFRTLPLILSQQMLNASSFIQHHSGLRLTCLPWFLNCKPRALSSAGSERTPHTRKVTGSIPVAPTMRLRISNCQWRTGGSGRLLYFCADRVAG
jgi:hypothetical protein